MNHLTPAEEAYLIATAYESDEVQLRLMQKDILDFAKKQVERTPIEGTFLKAKKTVILKELEVV